MRNYMNINDRTILTEDELNAYHARKYENLSSAWKEEGFYNQDEYYEWLRENDIDSEYVEVEPYLIHYSMIDDDATEEDVISAIDWFKKHGIDCEITNTQGTKNEYAQEPTNAQWQQMFKEVFGRN